MASLLCLSSIFQQTKDVIDQSGHFLFQYGNYGGCLDTPGFNYNLVELGIGSTNTGIYLGLCLPEQCTSTIIKQSLGQVLKQLQMPYNIYAVESNIQGYEFPYTPLFYITVLAIMILTVLVLLGTCTHGSQSQYCSHFALQKTTKIIFAKKQGELNIFNGVRALSMMWVILGHTFLNSLGGTINVTQADHIFASPFILLITGGLLSVDVFFFLGGFFLAFVFVRQKTKSILKYPIAILQRALRIWPAYLMTIIFYYSVFMHLGSGPRWSANEPIVNMCNKFWRSLLFIENIADNGTETCLVWGWYLQVDFQMFLVCLLLLGVYSYHKKASFVFGGLLIVGSWTYNLIYTEVHEQKVFIDLKSLTAFIGYFQDIYVKPWARWSPYILGVFLGLAYTQYSASFKDESKRKGFIEKLHRLRDLLAKRKMIRWAIQWTGVALMAFVVLIPRTLQKGILWDQIWHSLYFCYSRIIFIVGLTMVLLSTLLGLKQSFFRTILDTYFFSVVAKISFCVYLVHFIVLTHVISYVKGDVYYYIPDKFIVHLAVCVLSCFFGFLLTVLVQIPFSFVQKDMMEKLKNVYSKPKRLHQSTDVSLHEAINASQIGPSPDRESIQNEDKQ